MKLEDPAKKEIIIVDENDDVIGHKPRNIVDAEKLRYRVASVSSIVLVPAIIEYATPPAMNRFMPDVMPHFVIASSRNIIRIALIASCTTTRPTSDGLEIGTYPVATKM